MGLDMYLSAKRYVSHFAHNKREENDAYEKLLAVSGMSGMSSEVHPSLEVKVTVGYWRKANAIHKWFVDKVQDGKDECQDSYVSREQLEKLLATCNEAKAKQDASLLPPQDGFFFGGTDIDDGYWDDIDRTIEILNRVLAVDALQDMVDASRSCEFEYHASW